MQFKRIAHCRQEIVTLYIARC